MPIAGAPRPPSNRESGVGHHVPRGVRHQVGSGVSQLIRPGWCLTTIVLLSVAVLGRDVLAQAPQQQSAIDRCNVTTGSTEVNDQGQLVRPPPTQQDCEAAEAIVQEFLDTARGDFRRVDLIEDMPGNVSVYVGRMTPWGGSVDELPVNRRHGVTWLSDRIVVVVIETSDIAGPTTTVVIADLETHQLCEFERWPGAEDPRRLTVQEIQDVLDRGLLGTQDSPECRLAPLPLPIE